MALFPMHNATSHAPLQSDITTAVSLAATLTRVASGWWAAGYIWRCIFVAMERGGISAKGVSQAISSPLHILWGSTRKSNMVIIYITLFATFTIDYFSAVLTGSLIWEAANTRTPGKIPLTITNGTTYSSDPMPVLPFQNTSRWQPPVLSMASADASVAWILQSGSVLNITEPSTTFRRVIQGARGHRDLKKRPGVDFFFPWTLRGLTNYIIRHQSKYSNMTSSSECFPPHPCADPLQGVRTHD